MLKIAARLSFRSSCQLRAGVQDEQLFFAVADEGPGIPEEERAKIFDIAALPAVIEAGRAPACRSARAWSVRTVGISAADGIDGRGTCITLFSLPLPTTCPE